VAAKDIELCDCFLEYGEATAEMLLLLTFVALGTTLIWLGIGHLDWRVLLFAVIALIARPIALHPMLAGLNLNRHDRRLIAAFGPRGLSSLLLALLPVFAGVPGSEQIFTVVSVVVLLSIVVHGGGTSVYLRRHRVGELATTAEVLLPLSRPATEKESPKVLETAEPASIRITLDEMRTLQAKGEPVVVVDARSNRTYKSEPLKAVGSVRLNPDDPVRDATQQRLSKRANLVIYCA
jgi:NhaP-type Na+/H+ or K+/H+ antiporter